MKTLLALLLVASTAPLVVAEEPPAIDASSVFALRDSLTLLTPTPHRVSRQLAEMCAMAAPPGADSAERERAGPHAEALVNYLVSAGGAPAMSSPELPFPVGTVILKEKLAVADAAVEAVGGMVKRAPGFDPENGDWEYFYAETAGTFAIGRLESCTGCHARVRSSDHVFSRAAAGRRRQAPGAH